MERINIEEMKSEILDEAKTFDELERKLRKVKTTIMKKNVLKDFHEE